MKSETSTQHQKESSKDITCGVITLSDSRKSKKADLSGQYMAEEIEARYTLKSRSLIPDEKEDLINAIENMISEDIDVILTTGGTGLDPRDITVETVESLFEKRLEGFGEIKNPYLHYIEYKKPGSDELAKNASDNITDEDVLILKNHGVICLGENLSEAMLLAIFVEQTAKTQFVTLMLNSVEDND